MAKILISWVATANDFVKPSNAVNVSGPNCSVHEHYYEDYDYHVLLTSERDVMNDTKYQRLVAHLKGTYQHVVKEVAMNIRENDLINVSVISEAINTLLLTRYKNDEIDIFISPGTPAMQVAWYLAQISLPLNIRLFQTVKIEKAKSHESARIWITNDQIGYVSSLLLKEAHAGKHDHLPDMAMPGILEPIYRRASKIALADVSVLITGETGAGKERLARHIHLASHRSSEKFQPVNCAAIGDGLLESRLFGHKKGSFTGADKDSIGLFKELEGGTIFLDEIGDISPYMQQALLRVLSEGEIMKVGSNKSEPVNVRVIAATNRDIYEMSMSGKYRADLYYRLATCEIRLPSLAEYNHKEKDEVLTHLWAKAKSILKRKDNLTLPTAVKKKLLDYNYPGNIREMENTILGLWAESSGSAKVGDLPRRMQYPHASQSLKLEDVKTAHIRKVYAMCNGNVTRAAEILDVRPSTLRSRLVNPDAK
jgi:transcriptional regulator of acetoin/glycerol metabolism